MFLLVDGCAHTDLSYKPTALRLSTAGFDHGCASCTLWAFTIIHAPRAPTLERTFGNAGATTFWVARYKKAVRRAEPLKRIPDSRFKIQELGWQHSVSSSPEIVHTLGDAALDSALQL